MCTCSCFALVLFLSELIIPVFGPCLLLQNVLRERDTFKTFYYELWTQVHVFDFKPSCAKYLGFLVHFSQIAVTMLVGTEEYPREKGTPPPRGPQYRAAPQFSVFIPFSIHGGGVSRFSHFWLEKEHCICKISPFCNFLDLIWPVLCTQNCHLFTRSEEAPQPLSAARRRVSVRGELQLLSYCDLG